MQTIERKTILFVGAIVLQLVALLGLGLVYGSIAAKGTEVLLKIAPVDPRDPLRGDYVTFRYDISTLPNSLVMSPPSSSFLPAPGIEVYVTLRAGSPYWQAAGVYPSLNMAQQAIGSGPNTQVIKGTITDASSFNGSWSIRYGIEQYFIPEGTGRTMSFWNKDVSALIKVDKKGNALIQKLYVDGQPWP